MNHKLTVFFHNTIELHMIITKNGTLTYVTAPLLIQYGLISVTFVFFSATSFTLDVRTQQTLPIRGLDYITFTVRSCGLVFVTLATPAPSATYFLIELAPEHIHAHVYDPDCRNGAADQSTEKNLTQETGFDCKANATSYW